MTYFFHCLFRAIAGLETRNGDLRFRPGYARSNLALSNGYPALNPARRAFENSFVELPAGKSCLRDDTPDATLSLDKSVAESLRAVFSSFLTINPRQTPDLSQ